MADNKFLEELKKATQQVQAIASMEAKERAEYLEAVSKQFFELQQTVHSIISEEGIILNNFDWVWIDAGEHNRKSVDQFISNKAELFANKYGFSKDVVRKLLFTKNTGVICSSYSDLYYYYMLVPKE